MTEGSFAGDDGTNWERYESNLRDGLEYYTTNSEAFFGALADEARACLAELAGKLGATA